MEKKVNRTKKDQEQIERDDAKKMKLELAFQRELKSLFARMNRENSRSIENISVTIRADKFKDEFEALLRKHYIRVQDSFVGTVENTLDADDQGFSEFEKTLLGAALMEWRDEKAPNSATIITNTNRRQIIRSQQQAREILIEDGKETDNRNISLVAAAIFRRFYSPRVLTIAETETQAAAESTKIMEASLLSGADPRSALKPQRIVARVESFKIWWTMRDNVVRPLHRRLEAIRINANSAFQTGGESMLHPGDGSMGASAKNLAHCRCSLTFEIERVRR